MLNYIKKNVFQVIMMIFTIIIIFSLIFIKNISNEGFILSENETKTSSLWIDEYKYYKGTKINHMKGKPGNSLCIEVTGESGKLELEVINSEGKEILNEIIYENASYSLFNLKESGEVEIRIKGLGHKGGFRIDYDNSETPTDTTEGNIILIGEEHSSDEVNNLEYKLWEECYKKYRMRDLFIELPYFGTEYLNIWMKSNNDDILNQLAKDWKKSPDDKLFKLLKKIKINLPETIFHGTDVGHAYNSTGKRYLEYLEKNGYKNTEKYNIVKENIKQGREYKKKGTAYRENQMTKNFINEYNRIGKKKIMGIYGSAHVYPHSKDFYKEVDCMAKQLKVIYKEKLISEDVVTLVNFPKYYKSDKRVKCVI